MIEARIEPDLASWRDMARRLLAADVPPERVWWVEMSRAAGLLGETLWGNANAEVIATASALFQVKEEPGQAIGAVQSTSHNASDSLIRPTASMPGQAAPMGAIFDQTVSPRRPGSSERSEDPGQRGIAVDAQSAAPRAACPGVEAAFTNSIFSLPKIHAVESDNPSIANVSAFRVPKQFLSICMFVACHRDPARWSLMYRVLWRLTHGEPLLLEVAVDPDVHQLMMLDKAVHRDRHKMTAFVRFRKVMDEAGAERYIAWHRPDHRIVRLTAPFFAERFAALRWAILTPDESVAWDGQSLQFAPGVPRSAAPGPDEMESLWKTYYGSIFNPARVNLKAMRAEMPLKHWATLPETEIIEDLLEDAPRRVAEMARQGKAAERPEKSAAQLAAQALSLPQLRDAAKTCRACPLHCQATQTVFGEGPMDAKLVLVGEQPGDEEDQTGRPFIGPAGKLLDEVLNQVGIDRKAVYVTNAVKHFKWEPRGKRRLHKTPSARESAACAPWLAAELSLIRPPKLVCLGATAARAVFGRDFRLTDQRGQPRPTPWSPWTMATWHPSALLRIPDAQRREQSRRQFEADLRKIITMA